jgi:tRNA-dihydrouridine synthase
VNVPVLSNGNVREWRDLLVNKQLTACDGLMVGEALLTDPTLFSPKPESKKWRKVAGGVPRASVVLGRVREYLELAEAHPYVSARNLPRTNLDLGLAST